MAGLVVVAVNRMPAAEVEVSADLVRRLLAGRHLDLARLPVEFLERPGQRAVPESGMSWWRGCGVAPGRGGLSFPFGVLAYVYW